MTAVTRTMTPAMIGRRGSADTLIPVLYSEDVP